MLAEVTESGKVGEKCSEEKKQDSSTLGMKGNIGEAWSRYT